jgi:hypothetical protein
MRTLCSNNHSLLIEKSVPKCTQAGTVRSVEPT